MLRRVRTYDVFQRINRYATVSLLLIIGRQVVKIRLKHDKKYSNKLTDFQQRGSILNYPMSFHNLWYPQRDSNPCFRHERAMS